MGKSDHEGFMLSWQHIEAQYFTVFYISLRNLEFQMIPKNNKNHRQYRVHFVYVCNSDSEKTFKIFRLDLML